MGSAPGASTSERMDFIRNGAIVRRGAVSPAVASDAFEYIRTVYGNGTADAEAISTYTNTTFVPALRSDAALLNLYDRSGLRELAESLLAPARAQLLSTLQVQIRLPFETQPPKALHIDGVACPHLPATELRTFTLLAGVLLTDLAMPDGGALHYATGGHVEMAKWFRAGWPPLANEQVPSHIAIRPTTPFVGRAGDVILLHHLVPHGVHANKTAHPRVMVYFRVKHERHDEYVIEALRDAWLEFPSIADAKRMSS